MAGGLQLHCPALPKILLCIGYLLIQTHLHNYLPKSCSKFLSAWHGPETGHNSWTLGTWTSRGLSRLLPSSGSSRASHIPSSTHLLIAALPSSCALPQGPGSGLSSSTGPASISLRSSHLSSTTSVSSWWSLYFPQVWFYSLFTFPRKCMQSAFSKVPGTQ